METKPESNQLTLEDLKSSDFKVIVIHGSNGCGKTEFLVRYARSYGFSLYQEKYTNGKDRLKHLEEFCATNDNVVIDNIELHLDRITQLWLILRLHQANPSLRLLCSSHSLDIPNHNTRLMLNLEDYSQDQRNDVLSCGWVDSVAQKLLVMTKEEVRNIYQGNSPTTTFSVVYIVGLIKELLDIDSSYKWSDIRTLQAELLFNEYINPSYKLHDICPNLNPLILSLQNYIVQNKEIFQKLI